MASEPTLDEREPYVAYLERLRDHWQRGGDAMAALRRLVGLRFGDAPVDVLAPYILPWCGQKPSYWRDQCHLTLASLFAIHQISWEHTDGEGPTNLGSSLARLRRTQGKGPAQQLVDKQLSELLLADRDTIDHFLIPVIRGLAAAEIPIDWSQLYRDLLRWWPEGRPARRWARAYWGLPPEQQEESD